VLFSWTILKALPYLATLLGGAFLFWIFSKFKSNLSYLKFIIWIVPFAIFFALNPIYEGDFSNDFRIISTQKLPQKTQGNQLLVITIPGCPYCHGSIENLKKLKKRNPNLNIRFIVCDSNPTSTKEYKQEIHNDFKVESTKFGKEWAELTNGRFPSFIFNNKSNETKLWSNDGFGVRAKDEIESNF
jgi:thioredoxin-related protein